MKHNRTRTARHDVHLVVRTQWEMDVIRRQSEAARRRYEELGVAQDT